MPRYQFDRENTPPPATRVSDVAISRYEHTYEVDPALMQEHVTQQRFPNWDTIRIVHSRTAHLAWMHTHWAACVISGQELLGEIDHADRPGQD